MSAGERAKKIASFIAFARGFTPPFVPPLRVGKFVATAMKRSP